MPYMLNIDGGAYKHRYANMLNIGGGYIHAYPIIGLTPTIHKHINGPPMFPSRGNAHHNTREVDTDHTSTKKSAVKKTLSC